MAIRPLNSIAGFSTGDPAITVVQANGDITTINLTANGISNLGPVSNLILTGGSNGQFIQTDGSGNLSFASISVSSISNGNSNVSIPNANSNVEISVAGNANVAVFTGTGANLLNLDVAGVTDLGNVGNVHIDGGNSGQFLKTDGNGNLSWDDVGNITSNTAAPMPYFIAANTSFIVNEFKQGLYAQPIEIDGELVVDGMLIEISDTVQSSDNQILFDFNGVPTGNAGFEFQYWDGNLNVPGNIKPSGSIIPSADDTYDLGNSTRRWRNGYFGGNTLYLDSASISVDANGYVVITNAVGGQFIVEGNTVSGTAEIENGNSNVLVYANSNIAMTVAGTPNVMVVTTAGANLTGNLTTGGIKTDNLYYANGTPWNLGQDPGGSNTQIQFNDSDSFGGSAAFTFNKTTNTVTATNFIVSGNVSGNLIPNANVTYSLGNATHAWKDLYLSGNTLHISDETMQVNATTGDWTFSSNGATVTLGLDSQLYNLSINGNAIVEGNLAVNGNLTYINVEELSIEDPIINLQTGANGAAPTSNSGKDVGSALNYYDTQARVAFMGWDTSNAEFAFGSQTSISSEVVTFTTLGNVRASTILANINGSTGTFSGNISAANASLGNIANANYLVSNSGCVSVGGAFIAVSAGTGGVFNSGVNDINLGFAANIIMGSTTGNVTARGNLIANNISTTGNVSASLVTGTLTTNAQPNITSVGTLTSLTVTGNISGNNATANTITTNSTISKRGNINVVTDTVIDSFPANAYRTAKYVVKSENDNGYESLEVLLIHNNINSYVTVYAAINDGGGNTVSITTGISSGNVELRATGLAANTVVNLIGTYVPD